MSEERAVRGASEQSRLISRRGFLGTTLQLVGAAALSLVMPSSIRATPSDAPGPGVPVLGYHPTFSDEWTVGAFRHQMQTIHNLGLRCISFRALRWYMENGGAPPGCVILTVDDIGAAKACCDRQGNLAGPYANFWLRMYPEFCRYGLQTVLGVVTGSIPEEADGWDWRKIRFLYQMGHELASHSVTHRYEMTGRSGQLTREEFLREFAESKATIQAKCGVEPIAYVWPFNAVRFKEEAAALYPVLVTYGEGGPVRTRKQLQAVPRYHAELHQGQDFCELMRPFAWEDDLGQLHAAWRLAETTYTVQSGDNLGSIARRYGTTVSAIAEANRYRYPDLANGILRTNMRLLIPSRRRFLGGP